MVFEILCQNVKTIKNIIKIRGKKTEPYHCLKHKAASHQTNYHIL